jgi:hypothetical protein
MVGVGLGIEHHGPLLASLGLSPVLVMESRPHRRRPKVSPAVRHLIRTMSLANPGWGGPRVHGQLLKLGIEIGETSMAKYMPHSRRRLPKSLIRRLETTVTPDVQRTYKSGDQFASY